MDRLRFLLLGPPTLISILLLSGCGSTRADTAHEVQQGQSTTRTTATATKTVAGADGPIVSEVVETITTTETVSTGETSADGTSVTTLQLPPVAASTVRIGAAVAQSAAGGAPVSTVVTGIVSALLMAWAAHKTAQASGERKRADLNEKDSIEGWDKLESALRRAPQENI